MQQDITKIPGSPGEQRRKEKVRLQRLNDRLESVLGNIRRDNIKKTRQIKDLEEEANTAGHIFNITKEDHAVLDKFLKDVIFIKSQQIHKSTKAISINKGLTEEAIDIGPFSEWNSEDDIVARFETLCKTIAQREVELLRITAENSYKDLLLKAMRDTLKKENDKANNDDARNSALTDERDKFQQRIADTRKRNEAAEEKVALYEGPEIEDAMQERIQMAVDTKEKELQAKLQEKLDKKAQELANDERTSGSSNLFTPRKIDLVGDTARIENECYQLEEQSTSLEIQLKGAQAQLHQAQSKLHTTSEKNNALQKEIEARNEQYANMLEEIASLKNDAVVDKKTRALQKQLADIDANNAVRVAKYKKAMQVLLAALNDTEDKFKSAISLEAVLKEYEEILEDYEEQYQPKSAPAFQFYPPAAPIHVPVQPVAFTATATTTESSKIRKPKPQEKGSHRTPTANKPLTRSAAKASQGFPSTADKSDQIPKKDVFFTPKLSPSSLPTPSPSPSFPQRTVGKLVFHSESDNTVDNDTEMADSIEGKKKRKEPPAPALDDALDSPGSVSQDNKLLEIVSFGPATKQVVIKNVSSAPVKMTGYRIRNCDYQISQLLPDRMLGPGKMLTINPRPNGFHGKIPENVMFWQSGEYGTFEKKTKGVWLLDPKGAVVGERK